jgi:hypothetical protein
MKESEEYLQSLMQKVEHRERIARKRAIIYSLLPIFIALVLLWFTGNQLTHYSRERAKIAEELESSNKKLAQRQLEIKEVEKELSEKREQLRLAKLQTETILKETFTKESLQKKIDLQLRGGKADIPTSPKTKIFNTYEEAQGYVVVLGSYKNIEKAITGVKIFRGKFQDEVKLYYAINDYYAAAIGIISNEKLAQKKLSDVRAYRSDAYIFGSWAFPYEIKLQLP